VGQASACGGLQPARLGDTRPLVFLCGSGQSGSLLAAWERVTTEVLREFPA